MQAPSIAETLKTVSHQGNGWRWAHFIRGVCRETNRQTTSIEPWAARRHTLAENQKEVDEYHFHFGERWYGQHVHGDTNVYGRTWNRSQNRFLSEREITSCYGSSQFLGVQLLKLARLVTAINKASLVSEEMRGTMFAIEYTRSTCSGSNSVAW